MTDEVELLHKFSLTIICRMYAMKYSRGVLYSTILEGSMECTRYKHSSISFRLHLLSTAAFPPLLVTDDIYYESTRKKD